MPDLDLTTDCTASPAGTEADTLSSNCWRDMARCDMQVEVDDRCANGALPALTLLQYDDQDLISQVRTAGSPAVVYDIERSQSTGVVQAVKLNGVDILKPDEAATVDENGNIVIHSENSDHITILKSDGSREFVYSDKTTWHYDGANRLIGYANANAQTSYQYDHSSDSNPSKIAVRANGQTVEQLQRRDGRWLQSDFVNAEKEVFNVGLIENGAGYKYLDPAHDGVAVARHADSSIEVTLRDITSRDGSGLVSTRYFTGASGALERITRVGAIGNETLTFENGDWKLRSSVTGLGDGDAVAVSDVTVSPSGAYEFTFPTVGTIRRNRDGSSMLLRR